MIFSKKGDVPDIAGHSFGGWTAFMVAKRAPEKVGRVILMAPGGLNNFHLGNVMMACIDPLDCGFIVYRKNHGWISSLILAVATSKLFLTPQSGQLLGGWTPDGNRMYHVNRGGLKQKAMLIWGTRDAIQVPRNTKKLLSCVPNGE